MPRVEFYGGPLHGREGETQHWVHEFKVPIRPPINEQLLDGGIFHVPRKML